MTLQLIEMSVEGFIVFLSKGYPRWTRLLLKLNK